MTGTLIAAGAMLAAAVAATLVAAAYLVTAVRRLPLHSAACPVPGCSWAFAASSLGTVGNQVDDHLEAEHGRARWGRPPRWARPSNGHRTMDHGSVG